jgi:hypothetical protein
MRAAVANSNDGMAGQATDGSGWVRWVRSQVRLSFKIIYLMGSSGEIDIQIVAARNAGRAKRTSFYRIQREVMARSPTLLFSMENGRDLM